MATEHKTNKNTFTVDSLAALIGAGGLGWFIFQGLGQAAPDMILPGTLSIVPLEWFLRLREATNEQRLKWRLIGKGVGIHWEELDEDISVAALLK